MPPPDPTDDIIPATLTQSGAARFWVAVVLIGVTTGIAATALTLLLELVQSLVWPGPNLLAAAAHAAAWRHLAILVAAGLLTAFGQYALQRLTSANSIDITAAISAFAGRLPLRRTLGSAVLSILVVGMGASLGREGAPKQAGAVIANIVCNRARLPDEQRRLLVACGAGAGMAAAYGVPLGGALFAIEVLRGVLALRRVLPAMIAASIAAGISWLVLPDAPTYVIPAYPDSHSIVAWALCAGPVMGVVSVGFIRVIAWADRKKPRHRGRFAAPVVGLALIGGASIAYPEILGNGKDLSQLVFTGDVAPLTMLALLVLKPAATVLCLGIGVPGGLFTPSLTLGALLGGLLGYAWQFVWPGPPIGLFALAGAAAVVAATTHGPISATILVMELTGLDRSFILPLVLAVATATMVARTIDRRSIYDARFSDSQVRDNQRAREPAAA